MLLCWNKQPQNRPSFTKLRNKFDAMLSANNEHKYVDFSTINPNSLCYQGDLTAEVDKKSCHSLKMDIGHENALSKSDTHLPTLAPEKTLTASKSADYVPSDATSAKDQDAGREFRTSVLRDQDEHNINTYVEEPYRMMVTSSDCGTGTEAIELKNLNKSDEDVPK